MGSLPSLSQARRFLELSRRLGRSAQLRDRACCADFGLSPSQWYALGELWEQGPLPMNGLADQLRITRSTVTRLVDLLEKKGLARRQPAQDDRRRLEVHLTEAGEDLHHAVAARMIHAQREMLAPIPLQEREATLEGLKQLTQASGRWVDRRLPLDSVRTLTEGD